VQGAATWQVWTTGLQLHFLCTYRFVHVLKLLDKLDGERIHR
jgi:uncharacterized RmlC-like cupin family protein